MTEKPPEHLTEQESEFTAQLNAKLQRKLKAQQYHPSSIWLGLGMLGLVGWSIVLPTVLGALLGVWLDKHIVGRESWTLMLLLLGLMLGCANAWYWLNKEQQAIRKQQDESHD